MIRTIRTFMTMALPIVAFAIAPSIATAQSYSGNWPLILTQLQRGGNATYCVALTDNGSLGRPHSGQASLAGVEPGTTFYGTFQLIGPLLTVTIQVPSDTGQNAALVFVAPARDGHLGKGIFDEVYGGEELNSGMLAVGAKNDC